MTEFPYSCQGSKTKKMPPPLPKSENLLYNAFPGIAMLPSGPAMEADGKARLCTQLSAMVG